MFKISSKYSLNISIVLSVIFLLGCAVGLFVMPFIINNFIVTRSFIAGREPMSECGEVLVHVLGYLGLLIAAFADIMLLLLLLRVKRNLVFSEKSVSLIRGVSWCCLALGLVFGVMGIYFQLALAVCFGGIFLGICLRVVKNVIEEATLIKSENDLTV